MKFFQKFLILGCLVPSALSSHSATMTNTTLTLTALVNPGGAATTAWFEWGVGNWFDQTTSPALLGAGSSAVSVNATVAGLTQGLVYRSRVVSSNAVTGIRRGVESAIVSPLTMLDGTNPITNDWGVAYAEPGAASMGFPAALAGGRIHSIVLKADGRVSAWGGNTVGQTTVPGNATNLVGMASGQHHTVGMRANGSVVAWGENTFNQTNVPAAATNIVVVAAGESHCLALRSNGNVVAWGDNSSAQTNVPATLSNVIAVAAGQRHSLALRSDGTVVAWGYNGFGQTNVLSDATNILAVAGGSGHTLALRSDRTVLAWGLNSYFQTNVPPSVSNVIAIAAGFYHNLALRGDGTVVGWGAGTNNTGATPHFGQCVVPANATNVVAIAAGYYHSLALRADGAVIAWGAGVTSTGSFPNYGQSIVPGGLNTLILPLLTSNAVNVVQPGGYVLNYTVTNSFGGVANGISRSVFVTSPPPPPVLTSLMTLPGGMFRFNFTNATPVNFTVLASTNVALPTSNWTVLGSATVISPGVYQFTDALGTNFPQRFYRVRSP